MALYSTRSASQGIEFMEDTSTQEVEDSLKTFMRAQLQGSTQEDIVQASAGTTGNVVTPVITDFSGLPLLNTIDLLQKEIDEIAKRRRIATLQK